jgi:hypothetical protein
MPLNHQQLLSPSSLPLYLSTFPLLYDHLEQKAVQMIGGVCDKAHTVSLVPVVFPRPVKTEPLPF